MTLLPGQPAASNEHAAEGAGALPLKVAIVGASGYAGGEIARLLVAHPAVQAGQLEIGALMAGSQQGVAVAEALPHIPQLAGRTFAATDVAVLAEHDVVFLALPHGFSAEIAQQLPEHVVVIDCAADFRLTDEAAWEKFYGGSYAGSWPYGIPELPGNRAQLAGVRRIAVPGCFPTGATLAMMPAFAGGLVEPQVTITAITGVSGGGKKAAVGLLGAETMGNLKAYNTAGRHRHNPEIVQNLARVAGDSPEIRLSFTPVLAPLTRGILTCATAPLKQGVSAAEVRAQYERFYGEEPFIQLLDEGTQPNTKSVAGSNVCQVSVEVDEASGVLLATSAIDNLVKGTAGAAVQCMNLSLGYAETAGLPLTGLAP